MQQVHSGGAVAVLGRLAVIHAADGAEMVVNKRNGPVSRVEGEWDGMKSDSPNGRGAPPICMSQGLPEPGGNERESRNRRST